ncbi:hypothetical protein CXY01_39920 [Cellulomonas xylanilytica]|uniref:histidine kinase n=1 Tax=Cellulomonas xylanilytica TaxID=233583 RepID=A0A510V9C6_9CELL|nr:hypothetical protein CXY01_39920 [Cellulomonas xylanilytica]
MLTDRRPTATFPWREWVPSIAVATVIAALLLLTPGVQNFTILGDGGYAYVRSGPTPYGYAVVGGACVLAGVLLGRRWPVWATVLAFLPFLFVAWVGGFVWGWWLGLLGIAALAALDGPRRAIVPAGAAFLVALGYCSTEIPAFLPIGAVTSGTGADFEVYAFVAYCLAIVIVVGVATLIGSVQRSRLREESVDAAERHALEVESLAGERARLARDLHDVVAHHVSLVAVRAESAPFLHPDLNDDAREVLADIAKDAREALTELRQVLVVLQRTSDESERTPQPTACDVDDLVASAVAAGQPITLEGAWRDIPPATGYVLYRAVQEGLTNARRHAAGSLATVRRTQTGTTVGFRMTNAADGGADPGRGLIGMRERVEALGGTMSAVVVDGEFVLDVAVPA